MHRRDFLYIAGVGVAAGAGGYWVSRPSGQTRTGAASVAPEAAAAASSIRSDEKGHTVTLAPGAAFSLRTFSITSSPRPGDLRFNVLADGSARLDVVGFQPRLAGPYTKSAAHFDQLAEDGAFQLPRWDTRLHPSEVVVYGAGDAARLGRASATNSFALVRRPSGDWSALHVREASRDGLTFRLVEQARGGDALAA